MMHSTDVKLKALLTGEADGTHAQLTMQHISQCDECAGRFADLTESIAMIDPPAGLFEDVLAAAARQRAEGKKHTESLLLYSVRVVAGICAAIVLMFSGLFDRLTDLDFDMKKINDTGHSISRGINVALDTVADKLFNWEDFNNEQKK